MNESDMTLTQRLTSRDMKAACAFADSVAAESRRTNRWFSSLPQIAPLLRHQNSLVRNRAITILAANARWDADGCFDGLMEELLTHITDEKPITARVCMAALPELAAARPPLIPRIRAALEQADFSGYRDSMQPLLLKDAISVLQQLALSEQKEKSEGINEN